MEIPYTGRAIINDFYNGVEITVPAKKNWPLIIFFSFWLCGWLVGMILVPIFSFGNANNSAPDGFMILWLCGWTFGGIFAISTWWWYITGKEIITISQGVLTIVKKGSVAKTKSYDLNEAKNFRAYEDFADDFGFGVGRRRGLTAPWNVASEGTIKFDYGMETVRFGDKLYQAEGEYILQKLRDKKLIS
jgi:hypothetical protein